MGNPSERDTSRTQSRSHDVPSALDRVREVARRDRGARFTALLHHVTVDRLRAAYVRLRPQASPGVDGVTKGRYGEHLEERLEDLHGRLHRGAYRARPSRRAYIPKVDGRQRPLGIAAVEDKIVQGAVVEVLGAVYEEDFLGFSYGFRPGRGPHDGLDALTTALKRRKVNWVLDADIRGYFDAIDHGHLVRFIEHRVGDKRVVRLIQKWLAAGVLEDGGWRRGEVGTPQGATISPLLANVYLHYVFDLWAHEWRQTQAQGDVVAVRYADDFVVGFEHREEAERFLADLGARFRAYGLELHPTKTRLIEFGRHAERDRRDRGDGPPESFTFLGMRHICGRTRNGAFQVVRRTDTGRLRAKLVQIKQDLRSRMHLPVPEQGAWLRRVYQGYLNYHAVPTNIETLTRLRKQIGRLWHRTLRRRSQRSALTWTRMTRLIENWLPRAKTLHPWPEQRFDRHHPRQEPGAVVPHAGI